jgi:hypothetical protein
MKIIISESQQKLLTESKSLYSAQNLVDQSFEEYKEWCENEWLSPVLCDYIDVIEEIKVVSSKKTSMTTRDVKTNFWLIDIDIYFSSLRGYIDFDPFIKNLQYILRRSFSMDNIILTLREEINNDKDPNW